MRHICGLGVTGGGNCDPLHGINCDSGFKCSSGGICIKDGGNPFTDYACQPGETEKQCKAFMGALAAQVPVIGPALVGLFSAFNWFAATVLPQAYGIFNASISSGILFQPIVDYWTSLVGQHNIQIDVNGIFDDSWKKSLDSVNLPDDIPFMVSKSFLKPLINIDENLPSDYWDGYANSPEEALLVYLYAMKDEYGWNKFHKYEYDTSDTHGYAYIQSSNDVGPVLDPMTSLCSANGELCSHGPFGLTGGGWPEHCEQMCMNQFAQACGFVWSQRMNALQDAITVVTVAIARQVTELKTEKDKTEQDNEVDTNIVRRTNVDMRDNIYSSGVKEENVQSSGSSFWGALLGLGLIVGAGATIVYLGKKEEQKRRYGGVPLGEPTVNEYRMTKQSKIKWVRGLYEDAIKIDSIYVNEITKQIIGHDVWVWDNLTVSQLNKLGPMLLRISRMYV